MDFLFLRFHHDMFKIANTNDVRAVEPDDRIARFKPLFIVDQYIIRNEIPDKSI